MRNLFRKRSPETFADDSRSTWDIIDAEGLPVAADDLLVWYRAVCESDKQDGTMYGARARELFRQLDLNFSLLDYLDEVATKGTDTADFRDETAAEVEARLNEIAGAPEVLDQAVEAVDTAFERLREIGDTLRACGYMATVN